MGRKKKRGEGKPTMIQPVRTKGFIVLGDLLSEHAEDGQGRLAAQQSPFSTVMQFALHARCCSTRDATTIHRNSTVLGRVWQKLRSRLFRSSSAVLLRPFSGSRVDF